jgi:hypothetical protein
VADGGTGKEEEMAECIGLPTRTPLISFSSHL